MGGGWYFAWALGIKKCMNKDSRNAEPVEAPDHTWN